jgi:transposase InsO family protein
MCSDSAARIEPRALRAESRRGGLPGKEDAKRIQGFTNQWGIYNEYPSFIDNEDITCMWNMKYVGQKLK